MQQIYRSAWLWLSCGVLPWFAAGCAEGTYVALASVNPWVRQKWADDEKFGPTYHRRMAELRELRSNAKRLEAQRKESLAFKMSELVQSDPNPMLRSEAIAVLGELGGGTAAATLNAAVSDNDKEVRLAACRAWGRIHSAEALSVLAQVVERDADVDVRIVALEELGKFRDTAAIQALGTALDDNDPAVQFLAVRALKTATGRDYGDSVPAWRDYIEGREPHAPPQPSLVQRVFDWF